MAEQPKKKSLFEQKIASLDGRLDAITNVYDKLDEKMDGFGGYDTKPKNSFNERVKELDKRLDNLTPFEERVKELDKRLDNL